MSERQPAEATPSPVTERPTPRDVATAAPTATATTTASATAVPSPSPSSTPAPAGPCDVGPLAAAEPSRPVYDAELRVDPASGLVEGSVTIEFTPDLAIDDLYLRLWPNGPRHAVGGVAMTVRSLTTSVGSAVPLLLDPTIVHVPLNEPVPEGQTITMQVEFDLVVPIELQSRISGGGSYMRLGSVLPMLPWEPGIGWALDPATALFAESVTSPVADYRVKVTTPEGFDVLASGVDNDSGTWIVEEARDFALSVGRFTTVTGTAMAPEPVQITVGVHESMADDPNAYLAKVIDSLEQFSERWGQYPWPSLTLALTPSLRGGIEFPTHIMQGPDTIGRTTSHEVAHMFFYSVVGNNQGRDPWIDEGLASYAEFTYEGVGPSAVRDPGWRHRTGNPTDDLLGIQGRHLLPVRLQPDRLRATAARRSRRRRLRVGPLRRRQRTRDRDAFRLRRCVRANVPRRRRSPRRIRCGPPRVVRSVSQCCPRSTGRRSWQAVASWA